MDDCSTQCVVYTNYSNQLMERDKNIIISKKNTFLGIFPTENINLKTNGTTKIKP